MKHSLRDAREMLSNTVAFWMVQELANKRWDPAAVDTADAEALYWLLENEVVPAFYERDSSNLPRRWLPMVKEAIRTTMPRFSARRMVKQYAESMYGPLQGTSHSS